jgi:hypothetical protein
MRLINVYTLELRDFVQDVPEYVTASHRWKEGEEANMHDVRNKVNTDKSGYQKMEGFARFIREQLQAEGIEWLWIDTCCIDQSNPAEVTEAVNSMFCWYSNAALCVAYLADVDEATEQSTLGKRHADGQRKVDSPRTFEACEWFRRGWTLQELLAPSLVIFLSSTWEVIGHKGDCEGLLGAGPALEPQISRIAHIPEDVLRDYSNSKRITLEQKLAWTAGRQTKKDEDMYYSLLGLFDVRMWLCYGEGAQSARERLVRKIDKSGGDKRLDEITSWLSAPDPWSNHHSARERHEPGTGDWILQSNQYHQWKTRTSDLKPVWLYGKAGSGKTILFSTLVEDVRAHCEMKPRTGFAMFYFSFSDKRKQTYEDLLRSIILQLGQEEPALSKLSDYKGSYGSGRAMGLHDLEDLLQCCLDCYDEAYLMFDAFDECSKEERQRVLNYLAQLSDKLDRVHTLTTSREEVDIHDCMVDMEAEEMSLAAHVVENDIRRYIASELANDARLKRFDSTLKDLIETELSQRSDGM